jgi:hypothetical protein
MTTGYTLQPGDLLFQDNLISKISGVTPGYRDAEIDHVAMYVSAQNEGTVIEAFGAVSYVSLTRFLGRKRDDRNRPRVLVGRPVPAIRPLGPKAVTHAATLIGLPYDRVFGTGEDAYYCSELVLDSYKYANHGTAVFPEAPMSFADPVTGEVSREWADYFAGLGLPVPQGEMGSNPGNLSLSPKIQIVHQYGSLRNLTLP